MYLSIAIAQFSMIVVILSLSRQCFFFKSLKNFPRLSFCPLSLPSVRGGQEVEFLQVTLKYKNCIHKSFKVLLDPLHCFSNQDNRFSFQKLIQKKCLESFAKNVKKFLFLVLIWNVVLLRKFSLFWGETTCFCCFESVLHKIASFEVSPVFFLSFVFSTECLGVRSQESIWRCTGLSHKVYTGA